MRSPDEVFDLRRRERRRYAPYYLDQADGPVRVDEPRRPRDPVKRIRDRRRPSTTLLR